jgi:hypothetical protein
MALFCDGIWVRYYNEDLPTPPFWPLAMKLITQRKYSSKQTTFLDNTQQYIVKTEVYCGDPRPNHQQ